MSSKKESWNLGKNGKGTKTTIETRDDGRQKITVQKAHTDWWGNKHAREIISTENRIPKRK